LIFTSLFYNSFAFLSIENLIFCPCLEFKIIFFEKKPFFYEKIKKISQKAIDFHALT